MGGHLHTVHVALVVESFPFRVLHLAGVGTEGDQAVVVEVALAPIPIVEAFESAEANFEEFSITRLASARTSGLLASKRAATSSGVDSASLTFRAWVMRGIENAAAVIPALVKNARRLTEDGIKCRSITNHLI